MKKTDHELRFYAACLAIIFFLSGCASTSSPAKPTLPDRYALPDVQPKNFAPEEGSLFSDNSLDLYKDSRASRVGDILMVEIVETSNGKKNARTKTERESTVGAGISQLFGLDSLIADANIQAEMQNDFEGTGETERNSTMTATLSAKVVDVTPDNNLVIQAYREIRVNNETQFIVLSGLVRPRDISPNNSIKSTHIADARIEYSGTGVVADKQKPGWLARGLDVIWPF
ncbi:MAG: flagellar biosynthesis protein FlgH [Desulfobulbaceae bacterium DB1]|nr:MAG: flagellar biosynthesis protein FlgH [Desulfobulbaceae bacterium DB1]